MSSRRWRGDGQPALGRCGSCGATIPRQRLAVRYEMAGEWPRLLAGCPDCGDVVHPV